MNDEIKTKIEELVETIASSHFAGKPAILLQATYYSVERFVENKIAEINETFKDY